MNMTKLISLSFLIANFFLSSQAFSQQVDPRVQENPILSDLLKSDPLLLDEVLIELDRLLIVEPVPSTRELKDTSPEVRSAVERNPLFEELYKRDHKSTVKLIRLIIDSKK